MNLSGVILGTAEAKALATIPSIKFLYASSPYPPADAATLLRNAFPKAQLSVDDN